MTKVVEDVVKVILAGKEDEGIKKKAEGVYALVMSEILGYACEQTMSSRRKRFQEKLAERLLKTDYVMGWQGNGIVVRHKG